MKTVFLVVYTSGEYEEYQLRPVRVFETKEEGERFAASAMEGFKAAHARAARYRNPDDSRAYRERWRHAQDDGARLTDYKVSYSTTEIPMGWPVGAAKEPQ